MEATDITGTATTDGCEFARACQTGSDIYRRMVCDGVDIEDDDELAIAFDHAIEQYDVAPNYVGAAWASVLDWRESDLEGERMFDSE